MIKERINKKIWAVIPARGGSKSIPKKNIAPLGGKPLITYSIDSLKISEQFDKIIVTSDSQEILDCAQEVGVDTYLRQDESDSDNFTMPDFPVISYLNSLPDRQLPEFCFMVQCTSPFIKPETWQLACSKLSANEYITVFAAFESYFFLWEGDKSQKNNFVDPINHPFHERLGRQYLEKTQLTETGAFYGFKTKSFLSAKHRFFSKAFPIITNDIENIEIDTFKDLEYAEYCLKPGKDNEDRSNK